MISRVKYSYKDGVTKIVDLDTNTEISDITNFYFEHKPGEKPLIILEMKIEVAEYSVEAVLPDA